MATFRVRRRRKFAQIPNDTLRDAALSLRAKGLLTLMLSFPDDWEFNMKHLRSLGPDSAYQVREAMRELREAGYIIRHRVQGDWTYDVHEARELADANDSTLTTIVDAETDSTLTNTARANFTDANIVDHKNTDPSTKTETETKTEKAQGSEKPELSQKKTGFNPLEAALPDNVPPDLWAAFVKHRSEIRKKLTPTATTALLNKLQGFGRSAPAALQNSIENGWQGVFMPKDTPNRSNDAAARRAADLLDALGGPDAG